MMSSIHPYPLQQMRVIHYPSSNFYLVQFQRRGRFEYLTGQRGERRVFRDLEEINMQLQQDYTLISNPNPHLQAF